MIKSNKGITLIALLITIIIIIIIASIATYYGTKNLSDAKFERLRSQIQTIQLKVNELYEDYRSGGQSIDDELASIDSNNTTWKAVTENEKYSNINFGDINDYKKYYPSDTEKKLDISDFDETLFINIKNRRIIIENGYQYEGETFYIIEDFESLMYNTDYSGFKYEVSDDYPYSTITISDIYIKGTSFTGKNRFDKREFLLINDFQKETNSYKFSSINYLEPNTEYKMSVKRYNESAVNSENCIFIVSGGIFSQGDGKWFAINHRGIQTEINTGVFHTSISGFLTIGYSKSDGMQQEQLNRIWQNTDVQIEKGEVATSYEPYVDIRYKKNGEDEWKRTNVYTMKNDEDGSMKQQIQISEAGTYSIKIEALGTNGNSLGSVQYDNIEVNPFQDTANAPELSEGMIPVVWDREKLSWVKADSSNTANAWYNYSKSENKWANVVIVSENGTNSRNFYKNAEEGTEILSDDIQAMFVWIPRFKYTLNGPAYNVVFSNGLKDVTTSGSTLPSSFEGSQKGIWVGKFECSKPGDNIQIKPNQNSVNNVTFSNAKAAASGFSSTYNLTGITSNMLSDDAWTAVSIISKYATSNSNIYTNSYYEGTGSNTIRTGMAGIGAEETEYNSSTSTSFQKTNKIENTGAITLKGFVNGSNLTYNFYEYWTDNGQKSSTTQNVYGIYDMVGGYSEYVIMGAGDTAYTRGGTFSESEYKAIDSVAVSGENINASYRVMLTMSDE